ncbi:methyl-accepting chemotaxis protein [Clostridium cibarium]|uniref:MCP four helix bundle domain-containing protein n=1 Tax=Clostridium cibarium TaxID=2762247 RepID=A0ABR8PU66_9CLOT|nr:methyl-accepting chemotaxis protein [Clostridium cibarium]MBD7911702.1 MCP four helix bundle domain-containing protein [Clostridium cibarium]
MKLFYNMKVKVKILLGFLIVSVITGIIGVQGIINMNNINKLDTKLYEKMTEPLGEVIDITESFNNMRGYIRDILLKENSAEIQEYTNKIKEASSEFDLSLDIVAKTTSTKEEDEAIKELKNSKLKYLDVVNRIIKLRNENKRQEATNLLYTEGKPALEELKANIEGFSHLKTRLAKETSENNDITAAKTTTMSVIIQVLGIVTAIGIGIIISLSISRPIHRIIEIASKIADGDFDVDIEVKGKDELGLLSLAFKRMTEKLNKAMSHINTVAEQVSAGSKQVADSSTALSQGAMEQASSIEELTTSVEEISAQTKMNAEIAAKVNGIAEDAKLNAEEGHGQMEEMKRAVEEINNSSSNIYKIIKVIDEIAFQTNILALNAAVEAARAGQHGKGFGVVAEEVRNLAARSAKAAKETANMIEGSIEKAEVGTKIVNETAEVLNRIVGDTIKVAEFIDQITRASNEQAESIEQVNEGIMQVSDVVQTNSATSEESAAASEELASQAELLKGQVNQFKLKKSVGMFT